MAEIPFALYKNLLKKIYVKFSCPGCGLELHNSLDESGNKETCPGCQATFVIPGESKKRELEKQRLAAEEAKKRELEKQKVTEEEKKRQDALQAVEDKKRQAEEKSKRDAEQARKKESESMQDFLAEIAPKSKPQIKAIPVNAHLAYIRSKSCYPMLRILIQVLFWLNIACVALFALGVVLGSALSWAATSPENAFRAIVPAVIIGALYTFAAFVAREAAFLFIDIADTLLHEHSKIR
jgi:uncharacterized Zn finger protein (UPF0148 family)